MKPLYPNSIFRSNEITSREVLADYCRAIGGGFCPFIGSAEKQGLLYFSEYPLGGATIAKWQERIFLIGFVHTELLRYHRRHAENANRQMLLCENIIFLLPHQMKVIDGAALFSWPHWCLKNLYTEVAVLFGKFWQGERDVSRDGRPIPPPPFHLLSIRSAIKSLDERFFTKAPELKPELLASHDDGHNVLTEVGGSAARMGDEAQRFVQNVSSIEAVNDFVARLEDAALYDNVLAWIKKGCS